MGCGGRRKEPRLRGAEALRVKREGEACAQGLAPDVTSPHLPSLSRAAVCGHRAARAGDEPDPSLLPSPAHLRHHERTAGRGRRGEWCEGLCKGAGLGPVPGRAGTGGPEPVPLTRTQGLHLATPARSGGQGRAQQGEARRVAWTAAPLPPADFGKAPTEPQLSVGHVEAPTC